MHGRYSEIDDGFQTGEARITIVAAESASLGEFPGGAFNVSLQRIGRAEVTMMLRMFRIGGPSFFEPDDRLVNA